MKNVDRIEKHNELYRQGVVSYRMGINQFTDWTRDEFAEYLSDFSRSSDFLE